MKTQPKTLAKEIWIRADGLRYTLRVTQLDARRGKVAIYTNEADFITGYAQQLVDCQFSGDGLDGLRQTFIAARKLAKSHGLERAR